MGIASPVVKKELDEELDEEVIADPEYDRKKCSKTVPVAYYCVHEQSTDNPSSSNNSYVSEMFSSIDEFINASAAGIRLQYANDVYKHTESYRKMGWQVVRVRLSCNGGAIKLLFDLEEDDDRYKKRIKEYEASKKVKAANRKVTKIELPKPLSRAKLDKLPWAKQDQYGNFKYDLQTVRRFAKKYGIQLPKEIAEWKG